MATWQEMGKQFELMTYPGEKHAIAGDGRRLHAYRMIDRFFEREVKGEK